MMMMKIKKVTNKSINLRLKIKKIIKILKMRILKMN